ncbi:MAG: DUF1570 domain-containing protein [Pirellulales bacterium]
MGKRCFFICLAPVLIAQFAAPLHSSAPAVKEENYSIIKVILQTSEGDHQTLRGKLLVEAQDGSLLLEDNQQLLHVIPGETVTHREILDEKHLLTPKELGQEIVAQLPAGFTFLTTRHYVICYDTSLGYARWSAALLERLFSGFHAFWSQAGLDVSQPEQPLVVIIFSSRNDYERAAKKEVGDASHSIVGYYNQLTNRITTYDITGSDSTDTTQSQSSHLVGVELLRNPRASSLIATLVHEATHQLAFNAGLHVRLSPTPVWLSEGIATYFETPDLTNSRGWRSIGSINTTRLELVVQQFTPGLISRFIAGDKPFHNPDEALVAYAHAWAFVSFLATMKKDAFCSYIAHFKTKKPLEEDSVADRMAEFKTAFGVTPDAMEPELIQYINSLTQRKRP